MEYDKPMAMGEVRVCWKFLELRDDGEQYGVLYFTLFPQGLKAAPVILY
jgi:hypothetical protein